MFITNYVPPITLNSMILHFISEKIICNSQEVMLYRKIMKKNQRYNFGIIN